MRTLCFLALVVLFSGCASAPAPAPQDSALVAAMAQRLELSREVALIKYRDNLPVRDPKREIEVLSNMSDLAAARGMSQGLVRKFFAAQIAASCAEQERLIQLWKRGRPLPALPPRDLRTAVRKDIDATNLAILNALDRSWTPGPSQRAYAADVLRGQGFGKETIRMATLPL